MAHIPGEEGRLGRGDELVVAPHHGHVVGVPPCIIIIYNYIITIVIIWNAWQPPTMDTSSAYPLA